MRYKEGHIIKKSYITVPINMQAPHLCVLGPENKSVIVNSSIDSHFIDEISPTEYYQDLTSKLGSFFNKVRPELSSYSRYLNKKNLKRLVTKS